MIPDIQRAKAGAVKFDVTVRSCHGGKGLPRRPPGMVITSLRIIADLSQQLIPDALHMPR